MIKDTIIDEIHKVRRQHGEKFNFDVKAICEDYRKEEKESKLMLTTLPPKKPLKKTGS